MIGSLFSGIGGIELGLEMCGLGPVTWQCDNDPHSRAVLATHWPSVRRYEDVKEIDEVAERPEIICGGFPCQDISLAGKGAGIYGARSGLWSEYARIVRALRPAVVFVENVAALVNRGLDRVLGDLARLGFDAEWDVFQAAEAGSPHRRKRLFILAYSNSNGFRFERGRLAGSSRPETPFIGVDGPPWVAPNCNRVRGLQPEGSVSQQWRWSRDGDRWTFESPVPGVAHGIRRRMDRHRLAGNAVVPQQAALAWRTLTARAVLPGVAP